MIHLKDTEYSTACGMSTKDMAEENLTTDINFVTCWECGMVHSNETAPPPVMASIILREGQPATSCEVVNAPNSWDKLFVIFSQGGSYLVSARSMDDAVCEWIDYCEDRGYRGLVAQDPVRAGWLTAEEFQESLDKEQDPPDMATGGNHGLYYSSPDVHIHELPRCNNDKLNAILWFEHSKALDDYNKQNPNRTINNNHGGNWGYFGESPFAEKDFLQGIAADLHEEAQDLDPHEEIEETEGLTVGDECEAWRDVRLYLRPSLDFELNTGCADYDQDHRMVCGASGVSATFEIDCDKEEDGTHGFSRVFPGKGGFDLQNPAHQVFLDTAKELLSQIMDQLYSSKPSWLNTL